MFCLSTIHPPANPPITEPAAVAMICGASNCIAFSFGAYLNSAQSFIGVLKIFTGLSEKPLCFASPIKTGAIPAADEAKIIAFCFFVRLFGVS